MEPSSSKEMKEMHRLVCGMIIRPESFAFRQPVDWKNLGLVDYLDIIKHPMDLGTIKANLEAGKYETPEQVAADVRLVWSNCMTYNSDGSEVWKRKFVFTFFHCHLIICVLDSIIILPISLLEDLKSITRNYIWQRIQLKTTNEFPQ